MAHSGQQLDQIQTSISAEEIEASYYAHLLSLDGLRFFPEDDFNKNLMRELRIPAGDSIDKAKSFLTKFLSKYREAYCNFKRYGKSYIGEDQDFVNQIFQIAKECEEDKCRLLLSDLRKRSEDYYSRYNELLELLKAAKRFDKINHLKKSILNTISQLDAAEDPKSEFTITSFNYSYLILKDIIRKHPKYSKSPLMQKLLNKTKKYFSGLLSENDLDEISKLTDVTFATIKAIVSQNPANIKDMECKARKLSDKGSDLKQTIGELGIVLSTFCILFYLASLACTAGASAFFLLAVPALLISLGLYENGKPVEIKSIFPNIFPNRNPKAMKIDDPHAPRPSLFSVFSRKPKAIAYPDPIASLMSKANDAFKLDDTMDATVKLKMQ